MTMQTNPKKRIYFYASGKGGVGKTTCAVKFAEHLIRQGLTPVCLDADANNVSLSMSSYPALNARRLPLLQGTEVSKVGFQAMLDIFDEEVGPFVIDTGSNTFHQMIGYCAEMGLPKLLKKMGFEVEFHVVIGGGMETDDCTASLKKLAESLPWNFVVILNEFSGKVAVDGIPYTETEVFSEIWDAGRINGIVTLPSPTVVISSVLESLKGERMIASEVEAAKMTISKRLAMEKWAEHFFNGFEYIEKNRMSAEEKAAAMLALGQ